MMKNITNDISPTSSLFRRYLLGESAKNICIRLTVILSSIIIVWCGIICALIIHMKCQRAKQILKTSNTHHHLYDSNTSLTKKRSNYSKRNRRFNSSSSSLSSSTDCYSIRHILSQLKPHCIFWPRSTGNENSIDRSLSPTKRKQQIECLPKTSRSTPTKVQLLVESMASHNKFKIGKKNSLYRETDSSSGDELKNLYPIENNSKSQIEITQNTSNIIQLAERKTYIHHPSISFPINENKDDHSTIKRIQKLHEFNTKATLFFHPITRRLSNVNTDENPSLPPANSIEDQQKYKPLLMVSSAQELTTNNKFKWEHSIINDPISPDESRTSSTRHIPLVMITDTSSSNTNIVELETFEDKHRLLGDVERRLSRELRASYRPRHST